ncbi:hypothetical protein BBJ28_00007965 [Nothophytophthora sp. Chile5]|nr:hypothetical protein BBJ28_00007965 [Nothophytophthora sp. Chile5]
MAQQNLQRTLLLASDCPSSCLGNVPVMLGIDEAGRGPVMGPMVYGAAYWPVADNDAMCALGFDDSKALSAESRAQLWIVRLISAAEISDKMQRQTSNLNEMSRDAAIQLINEVQERGVVVKKVFVDTVGDPKWYQSFLSKHFNGTIEFRVEKKADSLFKVCLTASSVKQARCSTKAWLAQHMDNVFVFPNIIRFSWGTVEPFLTKAVKVEWPHEKELEKVGTSTQDRAFEGWFEQMFSLRFIGQRPLRDCDSDSDSASTAQPPDPMQVPECLHRGRLRQYSAQYGGWLSIKLLLFSHALVVDPDGDAPSAAVTPRRKRRNSLKMWMDLCLVANIVRVHKEDGVQGLAGASAAARRRVSYSRGGDLPQHFRFSVETKDPPQVFQFGTATESEREEWVRCLLLAKKLRARTTEADAVAASDADIAEAAPATEKQLNQDAFFRFASSGSEDSESDEDEENRPPSAPASVAGSAPSSWSDENALRSAQLLCQRPHPTAVQVCHEVPLTDLGFFYLVDRRSVSAMIPISKASKEDVTVEQVKTDAIKQLRTELRRPGNEAKAATAGLLQNVLRHEPDSFVLCFQTENQWFQDEQRSIGYYIRDHASRKVQLELVPTSSIPLPTLDLAIVSTKNKVSDLSQRSYTNYVVDVSFNGTAWQLARRFKEFYLLNCRLKTKYPGVELPRLPPKQAFTPLEGIFIQRRRAQLENYLKQVLVHPVLGSDVLLLSFLGVVSTSRDRELGQSEKSVIHVTTLHDSVRCGDIVLFSCRFGASRLQRKFTGAKYDHVGIVVPGESRVLLRIMEATSEGIQVYSLKARLMAYSREVSNAIVVRRINVDRTPALLDQLKQFVQRVDGNPYSIFGILHYGGESDRQVIAELKSSSGTTSAAEEADEACCSSSSCTSSTPSHPASPTGEASNRGESQTTKRKYFCSSLAASTWKHLGWLGTTRKSSSFWPGSFEDGGDVERFLAPGVTLGPEITIDCRIAEVGLATQE